MMYNDEYKKIMAEYFENMRDHFRRTTGGIADYWFLLSEADRQRMPPLEGNPEIRYSSQVEPGVAYKIEKTPFAPRIERPPELDEEIMRAIQESISLSFMLPRHLFEKAPQPAVELDWREQPFKVKWIQKVIQWGEANRLAVGGGID